MPPPPFCLRHRNARESCALLIRSSVHQIGIEVIIGRIIGSANVGRWQPWTIRRRGVWNRSRYRRVSSRTAGGAGGSQFQPGVGWAGTVPAGQQRRTDRDAERSRGNYVPGLHRGRCALRNESLADPDPP